MKKSFWLTVFSVNWGRGYEPGEFKRNVRTVLDEVDDRSHYVLLPQELDEDDAAQEHLVFKSLLDDDVTTCAWKTHEPIVLSSSFYVPHTQVTMTMDSGSAIGAPKGTGPRRHAVTCMAVEQQTKFRIGFGNTHPHRRMDNPVVEQARKEGENIFRSELVSLYLLGVPVIWGADANDPNFPEMIKGEKTAIHKGLDYIRFANNPASNCKLELKNSGSLNGTIDPHDPIWARFLVTSK